MSTAISVSGLVKTFGADARPRRPRPGGRHRRGARLPRAQRVRASRPRSGCCSGLLRADSGAVRLLGGDPWRDAVALHRRLAYVPGDVTPVAATSPAARPSTCSAGCAAASTRRRRDELLERFDLDPTKKARTYSKGNRQKVALVAALAVRRRAADPRRADVRPRPADGGGVPGLHPRGRGRGPHGAAVQPHPGRGRGAVRPGQHHPARPHRGDRHASPSCAT